MLPVAELMDEVGFWAIETWGGATFDTMHRFLNEDPWERLRILKRYIKKTPFSMLLRAQNLVGYRNYADDLAYAFVDRAAENGMDVFRTFDALNDYRNFETVVKQIKKSGKHFQGCICYTLTEPRLGGEVYNLDYYTKKAKDLEDMGADSICIKDMAGLLTPRVTFDLVKSIKKRHSVPVIVHSHDTAGMALASYLAAIDAGADRIDTSITPFANGTGQPDTVRMMAALNDHPRQPNYDRAVLLELRKYFEGVAVELAKFMSPANDRVDSDTLNYQVPGGMLSNFRTQLAELKMESRINDVMAEVPVVREALGWIPLVTPTSQIVGTQAVLNVKFGRWKNLAQASVDIALGKFGRTPGPINPELLALARKQSGQEVIEGRPADLLAPRMPKLREELAAKGLAVTDENAVLYAMFPRETEAFYKPAPAAAPAAPAPAVVVASAPAAPAPAPAPAPVAAQPAASAPVTGAPAKGPVTRMILTLNNRRVEAVVEELN
jgi:oxaloacetate decarboxylase alpha subunit/pyruvate carboxylase subunit B